MTNIERSKGEREQCGAEVLHRVTGTTPPTRYWRRCSRPARPGEHTCSQHRDVIVEAS